MHNGIHFTGLCMQHLACCMLWNVHDAAVDFLIIQPFLPDLLEVLLMGDGDNLYLNLQF